MTEPFWVNAEYDRDQASDGKSRYGHYVRSGTFDPWTDDDRKVELAVYAWRRATVPVMAPGYVRGHPRVQTAQLQRSDWDGQLVACVDLITGQPAHFRNGLPAAPGDGWWYSWPTGGFTFADDPRTFYEPSGEDLAAHAFLLCSVSLRFAVPSRDLPEPHQDGADVATCKQAIQVLVRELNVITGPILTRIEENSHA